MRTTTAHRFLLVACGPLLGGCAYLDAQLQSTTALPDDRIQLGWQDRLSVYARDLSNYTCEEPQYVLRCDRAGSITYSCTCAMR